MVVLGIIEVFAGLSLLACVILTVVKKKLKNMTKADWRGVIICTILSIVSFCVSFTCFNFEPIDAPKSNSSYSSGQKCELCNKKKATRGDYCYDCYETLRGFQKTWG